MKFVRYAQTEGSNFSQFSAHQYVLTLHCNFQQFNLISGKTSNEAVTRFSGNSTSTIILLFERNTSSIDGQK